MLSALLGLCSPVGAAQANQPRSFALLVGVSRYENPQLDRLRFTERDIESLAALIDRPGSPLDRKSVV